MTIAIYLTLEEILVIHQDQIDRYGGSHGLRDLTLLESAAYRPQTTFGNEELYPSLFNKAASLMHSIILNHPFLEGNKRTGMVGGIVFLEKNSLSLEVSQKELVMVALKIATKEWDIKAIAEWMQDNSK
ncbi:hypothetical protein A2631_03040 [Candidatus Daviesbacteria bacterium RIFCSPHIGHO2_01_FULL_44_29]|uniref:Fido domain-containing protein n=1 Tax=Candidatus Daviesbacteria bacterium RIFCSPHIGHO2_02_FULL_43_12 TaxID=1797776 RepID=A0A1F5KKK3_9BACT|nr:MAG: hypothetical protein A2631_03040 [Candidatus Daviesbacteria bacterium RIFCSPHIGHO2_01_FULL_44_29]OGE40788.1 MAG: hypothetical protein A3E86_02305 [Candidatus Daviesbacteria bacterium RIFCSPHIGHO2_12_FULL_47_45]OGE41359.1 MAG: hypothetical protein A3D25_02435 [Candidatus Daviesbacteria bacterium RIFCSPHIGHO2_02_FULL_43_12]OGE69560.1 MAG: hypothetical protein A3B55_04180 [Candidatus Daviesbacteria bacterium RIFCSPLOWO2_01_FULL_43_15]